jgi:succinyl-CoA synthetase beta subunit
MNPHEYQAKELLKKYGVPLQEGFACSTPQEVKEDYYNIKNYILLFKDAVFLTHRCQSP